MDHSALDRSFRNDQMLSVVHFSESRSTEFGTSCNYENRRKQSLVSYRQTSDECILRRNDTKEFFRMHSSIYLRMLLA